MCPNETPGAEGAGKVQDREDKEILGKAEQGKSRKVRTRQFRER
jgi:hypothetical protein